MTSRSEAAEPDHAIARSPQSLRTGQMVMKRAVWREEHVGMTRPIPAEDTFLVTTYLTDVAHHELWSRGRPVIAQGYAAHSLRIVNLQAEYSCRITSPHESLRFYIPRATLDDLADEEGQRRVDTLSCVPGTLDPVLGHIGQALLPALTHPQTACPLFIEQIGQVVCTHLAHRYGGFEPRRASPAGGLSPAQERRAKAIMTASPGQAPSLAEVARECGLSRGYFIRAFKISSGVTPHRWLQQQRVAQAKSLLRATATPIADIAIQCGFADQSHLTRVFGNLTGLSPAVWRREYSR